MERVSGVAEIEVVVVGVESPAIGIRLTCSALRIFVVLSC
jgi:hypothetical protein